MLRVLVVTDDEGARPNAARVLESCGFLVDIATDGAEAIDRLTHSTYEAMVLQVLMPRIDGHGVLVHLSRTNPTMIGRTVLLAAGAQEATELDAVCRVLVKPYDVAMLINAVYECLPPRAVDSAAACNVSSVSRSL